MSNIKRLMGNIDVRDLKGDVQIIRILEPRWHDRTVLVADWKLADNNYVLIEHSDFPDAFYLTKKRAQEFPIQKMETKGGKMVEMRVIPIEELQKEMI